jgi:hypothetical protein
MRNTLRKQQPRKKQTKRVYYGGKSRAKLINKIKNIKTLDEWNANNINSLNISPY